MVAVDLILRRRMVRPPATGQSRCVDAAPAVERNCREEGGKGRPAPALRGLSVVGQSRSHVVVPLQTLGRRHGVACVGFIGGEHEVVREKCGR